MAWSDVIDTIRDWFSNNKKNYEKTVHDRHPEAFTNADKLIRNDEQYSAGRNKDFGKSNGNVINSATSANNLLSDGYLSQMDVMNWQERMSNTSHQREVQDLKLAGLNPVLSANNGAAAYSASSATQDSMKIAQLQAQTSLDIAKIQASSAQAVARINQENSFNGSLLNFLGSVISSGSRLF